MIPIVDIVIVNWNSGAQLASCLRSIMQTTSAKCSVESVIVVDNGSTDGSLEGIQQFSIPLKIIRNTDNCGFAAACNQGAREGRAEYVLFLNPDAMLFEESLARPLVFLNDSRSEKIGIVGIQLIDEHRNVARTCARFPLPRDFYAKALGLDKFWPSFFPGFVMAQWNHADSRLVDHVIGAFFLVRRALFEDIGGFDETFFVYLEDLDFSLRAKQAGWHSYFMSDARAFHKGGGTSEQVKSTRIYYSLSSRIIYGFKTFSLSAAIFFMFLTLCVEPFVRICYGARGNILMNTKNTLSAYRLLYKNLGRLMGEIRKIGSLNTVRPENS